VLPNMTAADEAVQAQSRGVTVAAHLNLTEGRPLLGGASVPSLVDSRGNFWGRNRLIARVLLGRVEQRELFAELNAQICRMADLVGLPSHLDSHMNVHWLPGILPVVLELGRKWGIKKLRSPRRLLFFSGRLPHWRKLLFRMRHPLTLLRGAVKTASLPAAVRAGYAMPAYVLTCPASEPSVAWLRAAVKALPGGIGEYAVHPGFTSEFDLLKQPAVRRILCDGPVRLVNFGAVRP